MEFVKLPDNLEKTLLKIVKAESPTKSLNNQYIDCSEKEKQELNGIISELIKRGFINVRWADNIPYFVTLNYSARIYEEQLTEYESRQISQEPKTKNKIFISHAEEDKYVAEILFHFFLHTTIPRDKIFCYSKPGNGVKEKIDDEVISKLNNSAVSVAILSQDYYKSAYCQQEIGALLSKDIPLILIALPGIKENNLPGFLKNRMLRYLHKNEDVAYIHDTVTKAISIKNVSNQIVTYESGELVNKYNNYIGKTELHEPCVDCHKLVDSNADTFEPKKQAEDTHAEILEEQLPSFVDDKSFSTDSYKDKHWCLFAYMLDIYNDSDRKSKLSFYPDDNGFNFSDYYKFWMSKNTIDIKTSGIPFNSSYEYIKADLSDLVNDMIGIVSIDEYGLDYGKYFDDLIEEYEKQGNDALKKLIKNLSTV